VNQSVKNLVSWSTLSH